MVNALLDRLLDRRGHLASRSLLALLLLGLLLLPIYWLILQSFKTVKDQMLGHAFWLTEPTLDWYGSALTDTDFWRWSGNTAIVTILVLSLTLVSSLLAGYALSRLRPPGYRWIARLLLVSYVVPQSLLFLPLFQQVTFLHLSDTYWSLVLTYPMQTIPFCSWLFLGYFNELGADFEGAAAVDGASPAQAFLRVLVPMAGPVIVAATVFTIGVVASEFLYASVFITHGVNQTLAAGMGLAGVDPDEVGGIMAGVVLAALPVVALTVALAPAYVRGLTAAMLEGA
ncbi:MAG TPA: carbohydrate ABC transporter permease [Chloroflexota bacterium]|nr:carbohydrate ABC transporter permease [Chloroflexota bacterium]